MNNVMKFAMIVLVIIGAITLAVLLGMWLMHESMMEGGMMEMGTVR